MHYQIIEAGNDSERRRGVTKRFAEAALFPPAICFTATIARLLFLWFIQPLMLRRAGRA
jgi:hypothetical protein